MVLKNKHIIILIGNKFIEDISSKEYLDAKKYLKRYDKISGYYVYDKINFNKIVRYKDNIEKMYTMNNEIKILLEKYINKKNLTKFYNFFKELYNKAKKKRIINSDDIIDFIIKETEKEIKYGLEDLSQKYIVAKYFVLHSFIEGKILEKSKKLI